MAVDIVKREGAVYHFEGIGGYSIRESIKEALVILKQKKDAGQQVKGVLVCNGVTLNLVYTDDPELAYLVYKKVSDDNAEAYRQSDEYKQAEESRRLQTLDNQEKMNSYVAEIKKILTDWAATHGGSNIQPNDWVACRLMLLLKEYIELADNVNIKHYGAELLPLLEAAGYKENEFTIAGDGKKPHKQYETRAWFVGQMINMMKGSMGCAHPGLAHMVEKYQLHLNP
jgi:hypothetical protein